MNEIKLRLARLRELMKREHLSAFIFLVQMLIRASMLPTIGEVESGSLVLTGRLVLLSLQ